MKNLAMLALLLNPIKMSRDERRVLRKIRGELARESERYKE